MSSGIHGRFLWFACAALLVTACGSSDSGSPSATSSPTAPAAAATTTFQGTLAGSAGQTGTLALTIQAQLTSRSASRVGWPFFATLQAQGSVAASGTLHLAGGTTTALTGTYDSSSKAVSLSGGGYSFSGTLNAGVVTGTFTGPSSAAGGFSSANASASTVTAYCGTFVGSACDNCPTGKGVFNLQVVSSGAASGVYNCCAGVNHVGYLSGQLTGTSATLNKTPDGGTVTVTIQNGSLTGPGSTSGSTGACQ